MTIYHGDCLEVMADMESETVDAICTDPPYGIGFMGKIWDDLAATPNEARWNKRGRNLRVEGNDFGTTGTTFAEPNPRCAKCGKVRNGRPKDVCQCGGDWSPAPRVNRQAQRSQQWHQQWAEAAYRVAKPSAYLLAFGGTRTVHRLACAIEDAGWIIRDTLVWAYASGFPKSQASLKPAWEPIVMARKPGPLRNLNIDGCRIPSPDADLEAVQRQTDPSTFQGRGGNVQPTYSPLGRWPANVILTDPIFDGVCPVCGGSGTAWTPEYGYEACACRDGGWQGVVGGGEQSGGGNPARRSPEIVASQRAAYGGGWAGGETYAEPFDTSGTYSRFFLIPKADRADREPVLGGLTESDERRFGRGGLIPSAKTPESPSGRPSLRQNVHPTVKPVDLMRHLVRLVTPSGGVVLDPFLGSGTTAIAAEMEGFAWIGIEREAEYVAIAEARLNGTQRGLGLPA